MTLPAIQSDSVSAQELTQLPCFKAIEDIQPITSGYSQSCVKVTDSGRIYFAKKFASGNKSIEQTCCNERRFSVEASKAGIAPQVVYQDAAYLVCDYIEGQLLLVSDLDIKEKLLLAIDLMQSCHQLTVDLPVLDTAAIINELSASVADFGGLTQAQMQLVSGLSKKITSGITSSIPPGPLVPCHGDINFSNILLAGQGASGAVAVTKKAWLIDFECSALAEKEFDLAMLIAVNEIPHPTMLSLLEQEQHSEFLSNGQYSDKLQYYLAFCYLINALWYLTYQVESGDQQFFPLALRQFALLDELAMVEGRFYELFRHF